MDMFDQDGCHHNMFDPTKVKCGTHDNQVPVLRLNPQVVSLSRQKWSEENFYIATPLFKTLNVELGRYRMYKVMSRSRTCSESVF